MDNYAWNRGWKKKKKKRPSTSVRSLLTRHANIIYCQWVIVSGEGELKDGLGTFVN